MNNKVLLEILIDKQNEKGASIFEEILIVLHKIIEETKTRFNKVEYSKPSFSFEIAKIWNKIRFFIVSEKKYTNFLKNQIYAHFPNVLFIEIEDYLKNIPDDKILVWKISLEKNILYPIKTFSIAEKIDPYSALTSNLLKTWNNSLNSIIINFSPTPDVLWKNKAISDLEFEKNPFPVFLKKIFIYTKKIKFLLYPLLLIFSFFKFFLPKTDSQDEWAKVSFVDTLSEEIKNKLTLAWYEVWINILCASNDEVLNNLNVKEISQTFWIYSNFWFNSFKLDNISNNLDDVLKIKQREIFKNIILSTKELSQIVHLPTTYVQTPGVSWILSRSFEPPLNLQVFDEKTINDLTPIWKTNFRQENINFWIWASDRRRHMYIIWKTWMWKSTLLENMILDDIKKWRWVAVIDPHWDLAEAIIWNIPKSRTNQTIIFDPSDKNWPIAFNMLDSVSPEHRPLIASWLVGIFKKIFWDSWWPRLEHTLRNTILALLEYWNATFISIPLMLTSESYRNKVVSKIKDPVVKWFWKNEFARMAPNQKVETAWPILNKVGQFLSSSILRNILWQPKNSFNLRWAMDNKKIVIINLSKWKIWEDASALLWSMMVTKFQMDAMSRADILEKDREDFYLYVDEFQNFATDSFATILSEARKYKLNLVMANQYIDQMTETVKWAVFWNVWSIVSFQVWYHDAMIMKEVFWQDIENDDLTNLKKYSIYIKQLIDWMPSKVFSADTLPPYPISSEIFETRYKKILQVSREKYSSSKEIVEQKIYKSIKDIEEQEEKLKVLKENSKKK